MVSLAGAKYSLLRPLSSNSYVSPILSSLKVCLTVDWSLELLEVGSLLVLFLASDFRITDHASDLRVFEPFFDAGLVSIHNLLLVVLEAFSDLSENLLDAVHLIWQIRELVDLFND